jgi:hypothetical protein
VGVWVCVCSGVRYFEALDYVGGSYRITLPLAFDPSTVVGPVESTVSLSCTINAGCPNAALGQCSWPITTTPSRDPAEEGARAAAADLLVLAWG